MTITELQEKKGRCEREILALLKTFQKETQCQIVDLQLGRWQEVSFSHPMIASVTLDVRL